jgi:hypothetical protein
MVMREDFPRHLLIGGVEMRVDKQRIDARSFLQQIKDAFDTLVIKTEGMNLHSNKRNFSGRWFAGLCRTAGDR